MEVALRSARKGDRVPMGCAAMLKETMWYKGHYKRILIYWFKLDYIYITYSSKLKDYIASLHNGRVLVIKDRKVL